MHPEPTGPDAVVTGASAGIGREIADVLAGRGHPCLLVARSGDELRALAEGLTERHGTPAHPFSCDLTAPDGPDRVAAEAERLGLRPGVLVNNAGFGQYGPYLELDGEVERDQIALNVLALTRLTRLFLPGMVERGAGRVLNVASTAAFFPGPLMTVYYATKAYVLSYSVALAEETRDTGVTVTCVCPGPTRTRFTDRAGMESSRLFDRSAVMDARAVAEDAVDAMLDGDRVHTPGLLNKVNAASSRLLPRSLAARVVKKLQESAGQ